jgi:hypothetical protein
MPVRRRRLRLSDVRTLASRVRPSLRTASGCSRLDRPPRTDTAFERGRWRFHRSHLQGVSLLRLGDLHGPWHGQNPCSPCVCCQRAEFALGSAARNCACGVARRIAEWMCETMNRHYLSGFSRHGEIYCDEHGGSWCAERYRQTASSSRWFLGKFEPLLTCVCVFTRVVLGTAKVRQSSMSSPPHPLCSDLAGKGLAARRLAFSFVYGRART